MSSYYIKLVGSSPRCGSKVVTVEEGMTVKQLVAMAGVLLGDDKDSDDSIALSMTKSFQCKDQQQVDWKKDPKVLVRDLIPKQSIVHCCVWDEDSPPFKKPKTLEEENKVVISLSSDNDEEGYEMAAIRRRNKKKTTPESFSLEDPRAPTTVQESTCCWIYQNGPPPFRDETVLGKWMLFRRPETVDETWNSIARAVQSGELCAAAAKVATHSNWTQQNSTNKTSRKGDYVICVYTSEERMDIVGKLLIAKVQHDIRYKTDDMTRNGIYASTAAKASIQTLYWNAGKPDTVRTLWTATESLQRARKATKPKDVPHVPFDPVQVTVRALLHHYYAKGTHARTEDLLSQQVRLVRESGNKFDKNAIFVELVGNPTSSKETAAATKLGYLGKHYAAVLAPWMDRKLVLVEHATVISVATNRESAMVECQGRAHPDALEMWKCFI